MPVPRPGISAARPGGARMRPLAARSCLRVTNISERARWVACLLGRTRGHGRQDIIPSGRRINNNTFDVSDGDVPSLSRR